MAAKPKLTLEAVKYGFGRCSMVKKIMGNEKLAIFLILMMLILGILIGSTIPCIG